MCSIEISSGPAPPQEGTTVTGRGGGVVQGRVVHRARLGAQQLTGKTNAHDTGPADRRSPRMTAHTWPRNGTFWGGFTLREPETPTLRWRWEEVLRKSKHRLGYRVLQSKPAITAARHGVGALTCLPAKRDSLYGHKWKCQANYSGTAGPL